MLQSIIHKTSQASKPVNTSGYNVGCAEQELSFGRCYVSVLLPPRTRVFQLRQCNQSYCRLAGYLGEYRDRVLGWLQIGCCSCSKNRFRPYLRGSPVAFKGNKDRYKMNTGERKKKQERNLQTIDCTHLLE